MLHREEARIHVGKCFFIFRQFYVSQMLKTVHDTQDEDKLYAENGGKFCAGLYERLLKVYRREKSQNICSFKNYTYDAAMNSSDEESEEEESDEE